MGKPHWDNYWYVDPSILYGSTPHGRPELRSGPLLFVVHRELKLESLSEAHHLADALESTTKFGDAIPQFLRSRTPENTGDETSPGDVTGLSQLAQLIEIGALHNDNHWRFDVFPTPRPGGGDSGYYFEIRLMLDTEQAFVEAPSAVFPHHLQQSDGEFTDRFVDALNVLVARFPNYRAFLRSVFALEAGGSAAN